MFSDWGAVTVSGDEIGHSLLVSSQTIRRRLIAAFGVDLIESGTINRALLARRAFASSAKTLTLNRIIHPALIRGMKEAIRTNAKTGAARAIVIDAALLVEWGMGAIHWDYLVGVSAPYGIRVNRLRLRGLTLTQIRQFSSAQMPWREKRSYCDFIVKNDASRSILRRRARLCWEKMLSC